MSQYSGPHDGYRMDSKARLKNHKYCTQTQPIIETTQGWTRIWSVFHFKCQSRCLKSLTKIVLVSESPKILDEYDRSQRQDIHRQMKPLRSKHRKKTCRSGWIRTLNSKTHRCWMIKGQRKDRQTEVVPAVLEMRILSLTRWYNELLCSRWWDERKGQTGGDRRT